MKDVISDVMSQVACELLLSYKLLLDFPICLWLFFLLWLHYTFSALGDLEVEALCKTFSIEDRIMRRLNVDALAFILPVEIQWHKAVNCI